MTRKQNGMIVFSLVVYLLILVWVVLFHGTLETLNSAFDPDFRTINLYFYVNGLESVLNMLIFVPLGLYLEVLCEKRRLVQKMGMILGISLLFEMVQYILAVGTTDVMDLINNSIGGGTGLAVCCAARKILNKHFDKVALVSALLGTLLMLAVILFVPLR